MNFPIERYLNVKAAYYPSFSGDGRFLTFLSTITGRAQAWRVRLSGQLAAPPFTPPWPDQLTFAADRVLSVRCSPVAGDGRLLYSHDVGGNENAQLFLLDTATGQERCLTTGHEAAMHIPGGWSEDGRSILFAANRRDRGLFDLYRQRLDGGAAEMIWQHDQPGYLYDATFAPTGDKVALRRLASSFQHDLLEIDVATGQARQLNPPAEMARYTALAYSKDGRFLYVTTDLETDFLHVARLHLENLSWERLAAPEWDTEMLTLSPNGRALAYTVNEGGVSQLHLLDLQTMQTRVAPAADDSPGVIGWYDSVLSFSPDGSRIAFSYTSATRTSDLFVWDVAGGTVTAVTRSSHGGIPTDRFVAPELISYPTFDERRIPAWYFRPAKSDAAKRPVVIMVHGGPESQFRPYFNFLAQYFVHNGYAVLGTNVRGSTGYGKAYSHLDNVEKRMDSVADLAHAAQWLKQQPDVDPDQIVVYGGSYGGFMVLAALTHHPDLWAAGVNIVGISNLATFLENTSDYRRAHREAEYGSLERDRDFLESIAPMNHLEKVTAPLMVIHGANDPRVPLSEAEQLVAALAQRDVPVEFMVFDDEGHGVAKLKNKLVMYPAVVEFLDKVIGSLSLARKVASLESALAHKFLLKEQNIFYDNTPSG